MSSERIDTLQSTLREYRVKRNEVSKRVESSFLKTSEYLEELLTLSGGLVEQSKSIIDVATGTGDDHFDYSRVFSSMEDYLSQISGIVENVISVCSESDAVGDVLDEIVALETKLMSTLEPLKTMRVFFLIESVSLSSRDRGTFLALVDDIRALHEEAQSITKNEFGHISACRKNVKEDTLHVLEQMTAFKGSIDRESENLNDIQERFRTELTKNEGVSIELSVSTDRIAKYVSELVSAVQNDDIAKQKVDHVIEVIDGICAKMDDWRSLKFDVSENEIPQYIVAASKIQCAQLRSILDDYQKTSNSLGKVCPMIIEEVKYLDKECLSLREFSTLTTSADGVVQVLLNGNSTIRGLLKKLVEILDSSYSKIAPLGELSSEVNHILENITEELRVVTVNAKIKASKQSSKSGLNPLTDNVGTISVETHGITELIGDKLEGIIVELKDLVSSFLSAKKNGSDLSENFEDFNHSTESVLHEIRDSALNLMIKMGQDAERVHHIAKGFSEIADKGVSDSDFYHGLIQTLEELIVGIVDHCGDSVDFSNNDSEEISNLSSKYTMEQEFSNQKIALGDAADGDQNFDSGRDEGEILFF